MLLAIATVRAEVDDGGRRWRDMGGAPGEVEDDSRAEVGSQGRQGSGTGREAGFEEMGINAHLLRALARKTLKANASASEGYAVYSQREGRSGMGKDGHHVEGIIFVALGT
jgi:hypothetical protein